jgi:hypothetical protein
MTDLPSPFPAPPPPASAPSGDGASAGKPADPPKKRGWFVVLAWITLVGFGIFTGAITVLALLIEKFGQASPR